MFGLGLAVLYWVLSRFLFSLVYFHGCIAHKTGWFVQPIVQGKSLFSIMDQETCESTGANIFKPQLLGQRPGKVLHISLQYRSQTPCTGLRHPSVGGRCRKAMLGVCTSHSPLSPPYTQSLNSLLLDQSRLILLSSCRFPCFGVMYHGYGSVWYTRPFHMDISTEAD